MERKPPEDSESFLRQLHSIYESGSNTTPIRRVPELDPLVDTRMRIADLSLLEAYARLIERTHLYHQETREISAKNIRIYCEKLAQHIQRKLHVAGEEDLPTLHFIDETLETMQERMPELAIDVAMFMQFAEDASRFEKDRL